MLHFLSSLFTPSDSRAGALDPALIDAAIERAVAGTDRRLRALGNYRKKLRGPVEQAAAHVIALVDRLPPAAEISRQAFGENPAVRAFFSSSEHLQEVLGKFHGVRDYLKACSGPLPDDVFGLLLLGVEERRVLGMELEGDTLHRDVLQVAVSFSQHRYVCPAGTEADSRRELKKRAFDFLLERALERLVGEKERRGELERQRQLLRRKLDAMRAGNWGLALREPDGETPAADIAALEAEIAASDAELGRSSTSALGLEESLAHVAAVLNRPADWLAAREISLRLDYRGIRVAESSPAARELRLTELYSGTGVRRIALLAKVPRREIPAGTDFLQKASRFLG